jgi:hypothetical protein
MEVRKLIIIRKVPKLLEWYKIPEIPYKKFIELVKPMYDILENKKESKSEIDIFAKESLKSFSDSSEEEWVNEQLMIQKSRKWSMCWGEFHQSLMGSFEGWENYKVGHSSGCDIGKKDGSCIVEIKNNINTMNSSSKESVLNKLKKHKTEDVRVILVIINGDIKKKIEDDVEWINGKDFYHELSGRLSFMDDLLETVKYMFKTYKKYEDLSI